MTKTAMFLSILGFSVVVIVCLVMGRGTYHPSNLVQYRSTSGWGPGEGWLLGIGNGEYAFAAAGACVHIAEEIQNPSRKVPLVMFVCPLLVPHHRSIHIDNTKKPDYHSRRLDPRAMDHRHDLRHKRHGRSAKFFSSQLGAVLPGHG